VPLRLLCIAAHPDDECFAFGGALALYSQRGVETSLICITDGSAGSYHGTAKTTAELGQLRRAELAASCNLLGLRQHEVLDYQDGQLEFASFSDLAGDLVQRIRLLRPHIILTFSGDGAVNTHPDHTVASSVATAAFHWSGHPKRFPTLGELYTPQRLFYLTTDFFIEDRHPNIPTPWTHTLDVASVLPTRIAAMRAHTTQLPLMERSIPLIFEKHGNTEHYALAATLLPQPATQSTNLFEGVDPTG
jgi:LmbE family N-acetylglucosaminyl deacetylase